MIKQSCTLAGGPKQKPSKHNTNPTWRTVALLKIAISPQLLKLSQRNLAG